MLKHYKLYSFYKFIMDTRDGDPYQRVGGVSKGRKSKEETCSNIHNGKTNEIGLSTMVYNSPGIHSIGGCPYCVDFQI